MTFVFSQAAWFVNFNKSGIAFALLKYKICVLVFYKLRSSSLKLFTKFRKIVSCCSRKFGRATKKGEVLRIACTVVNTFLQKSVKIFILNAFSAYKERIYLRLGR